jgi:hypothetical protein
MIVIVVRAAVKIPLTVKYLFLFLYNETKKNMLDYSDVSQKFSFIFLMIINSF